MKKNRFRLKTTIYLRISDIAYGKDSKNTEILISYIFKKDNYHNTNSSTDTIKYFV